MKISEYPPVLPRKDQYTASEVGQLFLVSHGTACRMIDDGTIQGTTIPGSRERRVLLPTILAYIEANPQYAYVANRLGIATPEPAPRP